MYICPKCRSDNLKDSSDSYCCVECGSEYRIIFGIPDFRTAADKIYANIDKETEQIKRLIKMFPAASLQELLETNLEIDKYRKEQNQTAVELISKNIDNIIKSLGVGLGLREFLQLFNIAESDLSGEEILDVGCGFCNNTIALSDICKKIFASDISMTELIIAKKILAEKKIDNIELVCACSEALPFPNNRFRAVLSSGGIEHVTDQGLYISEINRVMDDGGQFIFDSPNRYYPGKEPHVNISMVGFIPRKLMDLYVVILSRRKLNYGGKRLLSYREIFMLLKKHFAGEWQCRSNYMIDVSSPARSILGRMYRKSVFFRWVVVCLDNRVLKWFYRTHFIMAIKSPRKTLQQKIIK